MTKDKEQERGFIKVRKSYGLLVSWYRGINDLV